MDFDFSDGFDEPAETATTERELLPEGTHELLIKDVRVGDRLEVRLAHADRRYGWVFCRMPAGQDWAKRLCRSLAAALGMDDDQWRAADPADIADRLVVAEIYHRAGNDGRTWVNVRKFLPVEKPAENHVEPPPPAPVKRPRKTVAEKAITKAMEAGADDDIPF